MLKIFTESTSDSSAGIIFDVYKEDAQNPDGIYETHRRDRANHRHDNPTTNSEAFPHRYPANRKVCTVKTAVRCPSSSSSSYSCCLNKNFSAEGLVQLWNNIRTQPEAFVRHLDDRRSRVRGDNVLVLNHALRVVLNGRQAYDIAAQFVAERARLVDNGDVKPAVDGLIGHSGLTRGLSLAAAEIGRDIGRRGLRTHRGSYGDSTLAERVRRYGGGYRRVYELIAFGCHDEMDVLEQLAVSDVPSDREVLFSTSTLKATSHVPPLRKVGVYYGPHRGYGSVCVLVVSDAAYSDHPADVQTDAFDRIIRSEVERDDVDDDDAPCMSCRHPLRARTCAVAYGLRGRRYHLHCFTCDVCSSTLRSQFFEVSRSQRDGGDEGGGDADDDVVALCLSCVLTRYPTVCSECKTGHITDDDVSTGVVVCGSRPPPRGALSSSMLGLSLVCSSCKPPESATELYLKTK
eukprot:PhM_4_TR15575/c0_g1_i1/m.59847